MEVAEDVERRSNGWGSVNLLGGWDSDGDERLAADGVTPLHFVGRVYQQSLLGPAGGGRTLSTEFGSSH